ncbi:MAG: type ISP restriction/modification enzyme [Cloacibacterium sp.]|uniref:type ISP restriction/modification enzyme n=1 Tax=Cloacibacterium sp. TaxID=1913682 RepID=UPI003C759079
MINQYLSKLSQLYFAGNATEHSYRGDLQILLQEILGKEFAVINEPTRQKCGAPDYIVSKKEVPIGYIEAKDLKLGIDHKKNKPQFDRYRNALENLIITDYLHFEFYKNGELKTEISLGEILMNEIVPHEKNFESFIHLIKDFGQEVSQTIKNSEKLAEMMANKALLMADVIHNALDEDDLAEKNTELVQQRTAFKDMLIHDIDNQLFADLYSQTIAYGLFVARFHDPTLPTFDRIEAANLIPKSNPFLRKLFQHIAGFDLDIRLKWIVEELVQIFLASDVKDIMKNFGKSTRQEDPVIHFYETFLGKYNPKLRKSRGVWYTPQPVVQFIVRAVDNLLKSEFGLSQGLADTSKIKSKVDFHGKKVDKEFHRVQVLDPATGTGTFLAETIKHIYEENFKNINEGIWPQYVEKDLIPRINGFELLMASYSMAHLKLDMLLSETGYETNQDQRFNIFLTNSLEEHHKDTGTLFASWLSDESTLANQIKRDTPVMCVIGNPPYSGESSNKSDWIMKLMEDYKKEPGGKEKLKERNPKWINDDYVKFIRFAQYLVEKNGEGIVAFINPHGFLDNPTFRGMRWNLLKTFDKIYTIDLHGNSKKKETAPDGSADQNVFDIMQGVSINLFIKTNKKSKNELGKVFHYDLYGKRNDKYNFLNQNSIKTIDYKELPNKAPMYFMVNKDFDVEEFYNRFFKISDLFNYFNVGVVTGKDEILIDDNSKKLYNKVTLKFEDTNESLIQKISFYPFDNKFIYYDNKYLERGREKLVLNYLNKTNIGLVIGKQCVSDWRYVFISNLMTNLNLTGTAGRFGSGYNFPLYLYQEPTAFDERERIPNFNPKILAEIEAKLGMKCKDDENFGKENFGKENFGKENFSKENFGKENFGKVLNFAEVKNAPEVENTTKVENTPEAKNASKAESKKTNFSPLNLLDYIYAVLHSPKYRETYKEFLKIDFPRVPFPDAVGTSRDLSTIQKNFWNLVQLGSEIRKLHLLEEISNKDLQTKYPIAGNNVVAKPTFVKTEDFGKENFSKENFSKENFGKVSNFAEVKIAPEVENLTGKVFINETQYFDNVPETAWNFYIGGYQPAQKWLKDRKERELSYEDILHYQKIIYALTKTDELMKKIDDICFTEV